MAWCQRSRRQRGLPLRDSLHQFSPRRRRANGYLAERGGHAARAVPQGDGKIKLWRRQERYLVHLQLRVYGEDFNQEFSLSDRSRMRNPLLLGRTFLKRGFIVNVRRRNSSAKYLSRTIPPSPAAS